MAIRDAQADHIHFFNASVLVISTNISKKVTWPTPVSVGMRKHPHSGKSCETRWLGEEINDFIIGKERRIEYNNPIYHNTASHYFPVERKFISLLP